MKSKVKGRGVQATMGILALLTSISVAVFAETLNDYNPWDVAIPDNGAHVCSDLSLTGAPPGASISKVKVYYEIRHTCPGDLDVWLTTFYGGQWHDYYLYHAGDLGCSPDDIVETRDYLHEWDGASPNQVWYLCAKDRASADVGYIDFFELWVQYEVNSAPGEPYDEDPYDSEQGIPIAVDLDWRCSDPDGDTVYYTVYLERNDSSPDIIVKDDETGSHIYIDDLEYGSHYYWKVKADDHNGGVTWSDTWDFYTVEEPLIDANLYGLAVSPSPVEAGDMIEISGYLTNTGNVSHSFGVGCEIRRGGVLVAPVGSGMTPVIGAGVTTSIDFPYPIPMEWEPGMYTVRATVWSGAPGNSEWLDSEDEVFEVQATSIPVIESLPGIIAFHRWSSYEAYDGELYLGFLDTQQLVNVSQHWDIDHASNPHFSPDGSHITFMGVPTGHHSYSSWEVYVWDMKPFDPAAGGYSQPWRVTNNNIPDEDPKFSWGGTKICFKSNGDLAIYDIGSETTQFLTTDGFANEEWAPFFSPDDQYLYYTLGVAGDADIWRINVSTHASEPVENISSLQEYFPVIRSDGSYFYTRWVSTQNSHDNLYLRSGSGFESLPFNTSVADFADAYPVQGSYAMFTSTMIPSNSWDLFLGDITTGQVYAFPFAGINTEHAELGCAYIPYNYSDITPVLLSDFDLEPEEGIVRIRWGVASEGNSLEFRLEASNGTESWSVSYSEVTPSIFAAEDNSQQLASGGEVAYTLSGQENSEGWQVLRSETVFVPVVMSRTEILGAWPNPFNPLVIVSFRLNSASLARMAVFDVSGREIALLSHEPLAAGLHEISWDGTDSSGREVASGVYLARLTVQGKSFTQPLTLIR